MTGYEVTVQHRADNGQTVWSKVAVGRVPATLAHFADLIFLLAARHDAYWGDEVPRSRWVWSARPSRYRGVSHGAMLP